MSSNPAQGLETSRWWDVGVLVIAGVLAALVTVNSGVPSRTLTYLGLALLAVSQVALGHRARRDPGSPTAIAYIGLLLAAVGLTTAGSSTASILLMVACPTMWLVTDTIRGAVLGNLALALVVIAGNAWHGDLTSGILIAVLSFALSMTIGAWVSRESLQAARMTALVAELREAQSSIGALERQAGQDAERERVAREIHDTIAQSLTGLVMTAQRARREVPASDPAAAEAFDMIEHLATDALAEARALVTDYGMPGGTPTSGGLSGALERLVAAFARETGVEVDLRNEMAAADPLSREREVVLLRCTQEALANVRKHAKASRVVVHLRPNDRGAWLTVTDDGVGLAASNTAQGEGTGIAGMTQRVALAGGTVSVSEVAPSGTRVEVRIP